MPKEPFDVNRDLGVPPVDWNKVTSIGCEGPKRYPSESLEVIPEQSHILLNGKEVPFTFVDGQLELDKQVIKDLTGQAIFGSQPKPLEEPLGETPKFNPVTQQFELPE